MSRIAPIQAATPLALFALACTGAESEPTLEVVRDTVGDTVVVRTVAGSVWGTEAELVPEVTIGVLDGDEAYMLGQIRALTAAPDGRIFALDGQVPAVRVYDAEGAHLTTLGRSGGGPGEFGQPDGGLAMLSDGRLVVRDPGNARLQVFGPDLEPVATWPVIRGGFNTGTPLFVGPGDTLLTPVLMDAQADIRDWRTGLQRVTPSGAVVDTVPVPDAGYEAPSIEARMETEGGSNVSVSSVPFSPQESWSYHPDGYFIHGVSTEYRINLLRDPNPLGIERVAERAPVAAGERAEAEAQATRNMRGTDPNWRWSGPAIPETKPPFGSLYAGRDGRIWALVPQPGVEGEDPDYDPTDPESVPDRWSAPVAFDVFEADGTYLGRVRAPEGFVTYPVPIFDGDYVWGSTLDDLGVPRIVRLRIDRGDG